MRKQSISKIALGALLTSLFAWMPFSFAESSHAAKPIIGINTDIEGDKPEKSAINSQYVNAIRKAGGIPVLLPPMSAEDLAELMGSLDGVMMIGGADYPPSLYKQDQHASVSVMSQSRSDFDMILAKAALAEQTLPFLGICAGAQAMNISAGGSLLQDIPTMKKESKIQHSSPNGWKTGFSKHQVEFEKDSKLAKTFEKSSMEVVTSHHQCVDKPAEGFSVMAKSSDGVTEAIEKDGARFVIGVQWHPERDFDGNQKLFAEFIRQSSLRHANKHSN